MAFQPLIDIGGITDRMAGRSPRVKFLIALDMLCARVHGDRYYVRRGPIDWTSFDFVSNPWACTILTPEFTLLGDPTRGFDSVTVTLEFMTALTEEDRAASSRVGLDDVKLETIVEDIYRVVKTVWKMKDDNDDQLVTRLVHPSEDTAPVSCQEMAAVIEGSPWTLQGIMSTFTVEM